MDTLPSQPTKSTRISSCKSETTLPLKAKPTLRMKAKPALGMKSKKTSQATNSSCTKSRHPITEDGKLLCTATGCNFTTKHKSSLQRHTSERHGKQSGKFNCNQCSYSTVKKRNLTRHFATHSKDRPFGCHFCEFRSLWKQNVRVHEKSKHSGIPRIINYQKTNKVGKVTVGKIIKTLTTKNDKKSNLKKHLTTISKDRPFGCQHCEYRSQWKHNVKLHEKRRHSGIPRLINCEKTNKVGKVTVGKIIKTLTTKSDQKSNLKKHLTTLSKDRPFGCHHCEYRSQWKQNVKAHEKRKHSSTPRNISKEKMTTRSRQDIKTLTTNKVQRKNLQPDILEISPAENLVSPKGNFHCKDCDYMCKNKRLLNSHMEECHSDEEKTFSCTFPGCAYRSKWSQWARAHERRAHNFTRNQSFQQAKLKAQQKATQSSRSFKSPQVQAGKGVKKSPTKKIAIRATKEKVKCPQCELRCYRRLLQYHLKVHSAEKPFGCSVKACNYRTRWPADLRTHMRRCGNLSRKLPSSAPLLQETTDRKRKVKNTAEVTPGIVSGLKCPDCDFHGKTSWHLNRHRHTHGNIPPIHCPEFRCRFKTRDRRHLVKHRLECHTNRPLSGSTSRPALQLNSDEKGCRFCGCKKKSHVGKYVQGRRGLKKPTPTVVDQPEVDKELDFVDDDDEEEKGNYKEASMEPVAELVDSTGFACMLCDFVGFSEAAALGHAKCHTQPAFPVDKLNEIPVICLD